MVVTVAAFSDTHNRHKQVVLPTCDIAIFGGDLSSRGHKHELQHFLKYLKSQTQVTEKVFIAGNHDICFDPKFEKETEANKWLQETLDFYEVNKPGSTIHYLENSSIELFGLKIWGSPYTPWFHGDRWGFNKHRGYLKDIWSRIPHDTDIVVTHGPPSYIMDYVHDTNEYVGCDELRYHIDRVKPKLHIFGHIHENWGIEEKANTTFCNATILNHQYIPTNQPHLIELDV